MLKRMSLPVLACVLFLAGMVFGRLTNGSANAQPGTVSLHQTRQEPKYDPRDPTTWPASLDALAAAPNNHKVLLENERVRVLEVTIRPGEKEPVHAHRWPSVLYVYSSEEFLDYDGEGKVVFDSRSAQVPLKYPLTLWQEYQSPHAVQNLSKRMPIRLIRVEIKK